MALDKDTLDQLRALRGKVTFVGNKHDKSDTVTIMVPSHIFKKITEGTEPSKN